MRLIVGVVVCLAMTGCAGLPGLSQHNNAGDQRAANQGSIVVKNTLLNSFLQASDSAGQEGGYNIPLPKPILQAKSALDMLGMGGILDPLKQKMNAAAASATQQAKPVFKNAINNLTITDALGLINGGNTAFTELFQRKTRDQLAAKFAPVVQDKLKATGFYGQYNKLMALYSKMPVQKPDLDIEHYVVNQTLDGLYDKMGEKEAYIRSHPAAVGSALLDQFLSGKQE